MPDEPEPMDTRKLVPMVLLYDLHMVFMLAGTMATAASGE